MTKICDADLLTLFRHENSNNSTSTKARATSRTSSGRFRLVDSRLKEANDSERNCSSHGLSKVGARRAALRRWGTAGQCPTKLWEAVGMNMESWEMKEAGKRVHAVPRYLQNCLSPLHTRKPPYLHNHGADRN
ncbi:hypothetical protein PISMIDRAFT_682959, partial [Pisolithus microcarpus 441]